jgi:hypothetical protein
VGRGRCGTLIVTQAIGLPTAALMLNVYLGTGAGTASVRHGAVPG